MAEPAPRTALVTGATAGIGFETAKALARQGFHVLVHGRDRKRTEQAAAALKADSGAAVEAVLGDFTSLQSVRDLALQVQTKTDRLDVLVNNAGLVRDRMDLSGDGIETVFQVNHLATFLLTNLLLPQLNAAPSARVVTVSSRAHTRATNFDVHDLTHPARWSTVEAYARSKGCNVLFTRELARRLAGSSVTANCLHPGVVRTRFALDGDVSPLWSLLWRAIQPFMLSAERGADTAIWLATSPEVAGVSGKYFVKRQEVTPKAYALDDALALELWHQSEALCALPCTRNVNKAEPALAAASAGR